MLKDAMPLKSHITFDGHKRSVPPFALPTVPYCQCMWRRPHEEQEIDLFTEEFSVFDDTMDMSDPRWTTPLGIGVYADLVTESQDLLHAGHGLKVELQIFEVQLKTMYD